MFLSLAGLEVGSFPLMFTYALLAAEGEKRAGITITKP